LANLYRKVAKLLATVERPLGMPETVPGQARIEIENGLNKIEAVLDLNAILQLDSKRVIFPTGFVVSYRVMMQPWNVGKL
jgi:hypothetical protein